MTYEVMNAIRAKQQRTTGRSWRCSNPDNITTKMDKNFNSENVIDHFLKWNHLLCTNFLATIHCPPRWKFNIQNFRHRFMLLCPGLNEYNLKKSYDPGPNILTLLSSVFIRVHLKLLHDPCYIILLTNKHLFLLWGVNTVGVV